MAIRLEVPLLAGAASLRDQGRSVRTQAPMQNKLAKRLRTQWRTGIAEWHLRGFEMNGGGQHPGDEHADYDGRRKVGAVPTVGHNRMN